MSSSGIRAAFAASPVPSVAAASSRLGTSFPAASAGSLPQPVPTRPCNASIGWISSCTSPAAIADIPAPYSARWVMFHGSDGFTARAVLRMSDAPVTIPLTKLTFARAVAWP